MTKPATKKLIVITLFFKNIISSLGYEIKFIYQIVRSRSLWSKLAKKIFKRNILGNFYNTYIQQKKSTNILFAIHFTIIFL